MENFFYSIPTKVYFGTDALDHLAECICEYGKKVLMVYGGGSIKRSGLYKVICEKLQEHGIAYVELAGVEPNPRITTVTRGVELCRAEQVQVLLPVGGGSTIDCAKAIAAAASYDGDPWELVEDNDKIRKALPIIAIPTAAATGSEMDPYAVITNERLRQKKELASEILYPRYALINPEYTYTVSPYQTAAGTADIFSHILEVYFSKEEDTYMQDRIMEGLMKTCLRYGVLACREPENYDARANLMWASQWAINGMIACGKPGPWPAHAIEHPLSACYDVTHGHGLAIVIPRLMKYILGPESMERFVTYGVNVFGIDPALEKSEIAEKAIKATEDFFTSMGLSLTLPAIGITDQERVGEMAAAAAAEGLEECLVPLGAEDIEKIYRNCFE